MRGRKTTLSEPWRAVFPLVFPNTYEPSRTENNGVHNTPGYQRECARNQQRPDEYRGHGPAVRVHLMPARAPDPERKHHQREDRQEVDRAQRTPEPDLMNPE